MKRIYFAGLSLLLAFVLLFSLTACSDTPTEFVESYTQTVTNSANFPYGGTIYVSLGIERAEDNKGDVYVGLTKASYGIQNFFDEESLDKIVFTYFDGHDTHEVTSDDITGEYTVDAEKVPVINNNIRARAVVYMTNGETFEQDCVLGHSVY